MLGINRPARIESDADALDAEFRAARWTYHRLLDFEDEHQRVLDAAAEAAAPGILRVGRILHKLARREKWAARATSGTWAPDPRPELAARLRARLEELRKTRNADPRWKDALKWADEQVGEPKKVRRRRAKDPSKVTRRKTETEEAFRKRFELLTNDEDDEHYAAKLANPPRDTRRDTHRKQLYRETRVYWGTWNGLLKAVEQARSAVLKQRKAGTSASWKRPRWSDPGTLYAERGGFRIVERGPLWWTIEMRLGGDDQWARCKAKCGNWHGGIAAPIVGAQLTRRRDGNRWKHSISLVIDVSKDVAPFATRGAVAFDWGHREHGHDRAVEGIRAFTWIGEDGERGEVLIPSECRRLLDEVDAIKERLDSAFNARKASMKLPERNRYRYRSRLMRSGVRTEEETRWLRWEMRYERRLTKRRKRVQNLRRETYLQAVRELRRRYGVFVFEDEKVQRLKQKAIDEQGPRRRRSNRDLAARFEFTALCEWYGADVITVPARNTTRECPECGDLVENGPELLVACPGCGTVRDKDYGAARVILGRGLEALAKRGRAA